MKLPKQCPFCGATDLATGYQTGQSGVYKSKRGMRGHAMQHLFCTVCGSVLYSSVDKPEAFRKK